MTDLAERLAEASARDKPWLLMLGHKAPHSFYIPEPKYEHAFDDVRVPYPDTAFMLDDKPAWIKERLYTWHGIYGPLFEWRKKFPDDRPEAVKDFAAMTRAYWGTILSVDDSVGRLVRAAASRAANSTTRSFVFMGDNGLLNGEHGMVDKRTMHEPSIRIPLIVRYPGLVAAGPARRSSNSRCSRSTLRPASWNSAAPRRWKNIHGRSWVKLVRRGDPEWRTSWFYDYNYEKQFPYTPNVRGVRTDDWKYIHYPHGDGSPTGTWPSCTTSNSIPTNAAT